MEPLFSLRPVAAFFVFILSQNQKQHRACFNYVRVDAFFPECALRAHRFAAFAQRPFGSRVVRFYHAVKLRFYRSFVRFCELEFY